MEQVSSQDLPYSNRELREKWHSLSNDLQEIKSQTSMTNGHVADINRWRERINGGAMVGGIFMSVIVMPILVWAVIVLVNLPSTINNSINKALSVYDVSIK